MTDKSREMPETPSALPRRSDRHGGGRPLLSFDVPGVKRRSVSWPLRVAGAVVGLLLLALLADVAVSWGRIHPGVTVGGVAVGGMDTSQARAALDRELSPRLKLPVTLVFGSKRWTVGAARVGVRLPVDGLVVAAYRVGRSGGTLGGLGERLGAWFGRQQLPVSAEADPAKLKALTAEFGRNVGVSPRDAGVTVRGTEVVGSAARTGSSLREDVFRTDLLAAFVAQSRIVALSVATAAPDVSDTDAEQAYRDAVRMVAGDVKLAYRAQSWVIGAHRVARWVAFRKVPFGADATSSAVASGSPGASVTVPSAETTAQSGVRMVLVAYADARKVSATVLPIAGNLGKPAKDARFQVSGTTVRIIASQVGVGVDVPALAAALDTTLKGTGARAVALTLGEWQPKLTTEGAKAMGIKERLSTFTTVYASGNTPRANNIRTLARALDGKLVPPGGTFGFNDAIGQRTAAKGYQEAPAIVGNKLVPQLGGGICQVGTTIFNAVFFSGFPVRERTNHSFYISHYPKGRDATINWGGPDFKFKNDSKNWVMIHTSQATGELTVSLYGTGTGYKVAYTTGPFTNIVPYKVTTVNDSTLPVGKTATTGSGVDGRRVVVVRTVTLNGVVLHRDTFVSVYKPQNEETHIGTMQPSKPATATPSSTATGTPR